jgi:hypothetical protein
VDIVERAKAMVLSPGVEWRTIERESGDAAYLFTNYAAILAAIPPLAEFVRHGFYGWRGPRYGFHHMHHSGFFGGLFGAVVQWLLILVAVYAMAIVIDGLAPTFSAQKNRENAMKLAVYSMTPAWLAGVLALIPGLGFLRLIALLYGIYVFWLGLPILMKPPSERLGSYAVAVVVCGVVISIILSGIAGPVL